MASKITQSEFEDALSRYPVIIAKMTKQPKSGSLSLSELDEFRYQTAIVNFNKSTGHTMDISDVEKLLEWKMHHGTFRPTLRKLVSSNSNTRLASATKSAFEHYARNEHDVSGTLEMLSKPLKGIGPAAASLLLSIHDPQNVVYFSDELYKFLCSNGKKITLRYSFKEYKDLSREAKIFMDKIKCTPIELEKASYVLIKEQEQQQPQRMGHSEGAPSSLIIENSSLSNDEKQQSKKSRNLQSGSGNKILGDLKSSEIKKRKRHKSPVGSSRELSQELDVPSIKTKRPRKKLN
ncbi:hypothetical protein OnM2_059042 [Erysiphe neolycopersici]|uniref:Uncharacterized protein n=1 Tax=Erysiphe neolycopersici TaxID=212602 RepID=A0A420HPU5_9PEZI|nr:hypothetical protein OnM2_059042 [Erysiphe neolycopersici]